MPDQAGFREIEHTADWELEVWAPDLSKLLVEAARGMYAISGTALKVGMRQERTLEISFSDAENLLVKFLSELLFICYSENLAFDQISVCLEGAQMVATLQGSPIIAQDKEIKAVTYHRMAIKQTENGLQVRIVMDV